MQKELMEKAILSLAMAVYEDFETYSSGVYQQVTGRNFGGHVIKLIYWTLEIILENMDSSEFLNMLLKTCTMFILGIVLIRS